jgi:hypothetical protein
MASREVTRHLKKRLFHSEELRNMNSCSKTVTITQGLDVGVYSCVILIRKRVKQGLCWRKGCNLKIFGTELILELEAVKVQREFDCMRICCGYVRIGLYKDMFLFYKDVVWVVSSFGFISITIVLSL